MFETWRAVQQFGSGHLEGASSVAMTPESDLIVTDWESPEQLKFFSRTGEFKYNLDLQQNLPTTVKSKPWNIIVSQDEDIFVTQQLDFVGVFTMNGACKNKFRPVLPSDSTQDAQLWGLTMDNQGCLLVGDFNNKRITRHNLDGSQISSFQVSISPLYIAVTPQDSIVVSNGTGGCAQILDPTGQVLHNIKKPSDASIWWPCSPWCTAQGEIYIANSVLGPSAGVYCYHSESGQLLRCITRDLEYPTALTVTDYGNRLVVAQSKDVKVFVKQ